MFFIALSQEAFREGETEGFMFFFLGGIMSTPRLVWLGILFYHQDKIFTAFCWSDCFFICLSGMCYMLTPCSRLVNGCLCQVLSLRLLCLLFSYSEKCVCVFVSTF